MLEGKQQEIGITWLFLVIFIFTFLVHVFGWTHENYLDQAPWFEEIKTFSESPIESNTRLFYGYPGTTFILASLGFKALGVYPQYAGAFSVSLFIALCVASITVVAYKLMPNSRWFLAVAGLLIFNNLYLDATPPSMIVTPGVVLIMLYAMYLYKHPTWRGSVFLGAVMGIMMATRLDISLAVSGITILFLAPQLRRYTWGIIAALVTAFVIGDPYMWFLPIQHLIDIVHKVLFHFNDRTSDFNLLGLFYYSPISFLGILVGVIVTIFPSLPTPLPRRFLLYAIATTVIICSILFASKYHPHWYFAPLAALWECLLPAFLLTFTAKMGKWVTKAEYLVLILVMGATVVRIYATLML